MLLYSYIEQHDNKTAKFFIQQIYFPMPKLSRNRKDTTLGKDLKSLALPGKTGTVRGEWRGLDPSGQGANPRA